MSEAIRNRVADAIQNCGHERCTSLATEECLAFADAALAAAEPPASMEEAIRKANDEITEKINQMFDGSLEELDMNKIIACHLTPAIAQLVQTARDNVLDALIEQFGGDREGNPDTWDWHAKDYISAIRKLKGA